MSVAYALGQYIGKHSGVLICVAGLTGIFWFLSPPDNRPPPQQAQRPSAPTSPVADRAASPPNVALSVSAEQERCLGPALEQARAESKKGQMVAARATLYMCQDFYKDDPKLTSFVKSTFAAAEIEATKVAAKDRAAEKARRRKEGVSIGMSQQDALDSSWGKPRRVNRTTTAHGTYEQWVYDGGYLYFDNGVLRSIQN